MAQALPPLRFLAEPRASYRARYMCEGRPARNRAQRFVRADENSNGYVYPTIEVNSFQHKNVNDWFFFGHRFLPNGLVNFPNLHIFV